MVKNLFKVHQNYYLAALPYLGISLILTALFFFTNYQRDWSLAADQEFTLAYNALLVNAGIKQEYFDHPGFFTIYLLGVIIKVSNFFNFSTISSVAALNQASPLFAG